MVIVTIFRKAFNEISTAFLLLFVGVTDHFFLNSDRDYRRIENIGSSGRRVIESLECVLGLTFSFLYGLNILLSGGGNGQEITGWKF